MTVSSKGKGKAVFPAGPIVIDSDESDDEDTMDFFTFKRNPNQPLAKVDPSELEPIVSGGSEDDEDEDGKKKKIKKRPVKKSAHPLPDWTRGSSSRERSSSKRGSTEDRRLGEIIILSSDGEGSSPKRSKGKGKERTRLRSPELTPPPELTAEDRANISEVLRLQFDNTPVAVEENSTNAAPSSPFSSPPPQNTDQITIGVRMVADKETLPEGASERAVHQFEKRRSIRTYRYGKLDRLWHGLAERLSKKPEDIVLLHNGHPIYSRNMTPAQLNIGDETELVGYIKDHWDRLEADKARETEHLLHGTPPRSTSPSRTTSSSSRPVAKRKINLCLRGEWGQVRMKAADFVQFCTLAEFYCSKHDKPLELAPKLRLVFDGDVMVPEKTITEAELDEGDIIDVEI